MHFRVNMFFQSIFLIFLSSTVSGQQNPGECMKPVLRTKTRVVKTPTCCDIVSWTDLIPIVGELICTKYCTETQYYKESEEECICCTGYFGDCQTGCINPSCPSCEHGHRIDPVSCQCLCEDGWTGDVCATEKTDCRRQPCENGGTCKGYNRCKCPPGWKGSRCEEIDEDSSVNNPLKQTNVILIIAACCVVLLLSIIGTIICILRVRTNAKTKERLAFLSDSQDPQKTAIQVAANHLSSQIQIPDKGIIPVEMIEEQEVLKKGRMAYIYSATYYVSKSKTKRVVTKRLIDPNPRNVEKMNRRIEMMQMLPNQENILKMIGHFTDSHGR